MASATPESDQERQFATLQRQIAVATREQGADPDENFRLRFVIRRAREVNMPEDAIEHARKQGEGELAGPDLVERTFEGYGSNGIAVLAESITDDPKRTSSELADLFESHGGNLGEDGCVAWQFERRGTVVIDELPEGMDRDEFMMELIESGVEDLVEDDGVIELYCDPSDLQSLAETVRGKGVSPSRSEVTMVPKSTVHVEGQTAQKILRLLDALDDNEDVQQVFANFDMPEEVLATA